MQRFIVPLVLAFLLVPCLRADDKERTDRPEVKLPASDVEFLPRAISCSVAQTKYAELAEKRAADPEVKEFARKLAADHQECTKKLMDFAKDLKLAVVAGVEKDQREMETRLGRLSGNDFDKAYLHEVVTDHEKGIRVARSRLKGDSKAELKSYLEKDVEKMESHLKEARRLLAKVEKSSK